MQDHQNGWVIVKSSDKMWSTRGGNGKLLQYPYLENPMNMNSMRKPAVDPQPNRANWILLLEWQIRSFRKKKQSFFFFYIRIAKTWSLRYESRMKTKTGRNEMNKEKIWVKLCPDSQVPGSCSSVFNSVICTFILPSYLSQSTLYFPLSLFKLACHIQLKALRKIPLLIVANLRSGHIPN